jgi:putative peptidoglycan lipid II flippase
MSSLDPPAPADSHGTAPGDRPPAAAPGGPALARSAGVIGLATMASRVLGLIRDVVLALLFGASATMDAFYVAFKIPNLLRDLFAEGAMSAAFVPTFTRQLTRHGRAAAWRLGNQVINALLLVTGLLVVAGVAFAEPLIRFIVAREYAADAQQFALTVSLTRVMLPFLTLVALAVALMGMLNSLRRFFIPALSPAMLNVATIACAFLLVPVMPAFGLDPIFAIAFGTLLGGFGQVVLQWPVLRAEGYRYRWMLDARDENLREILLLMGPGTIGVAAVQVNLLVNTMLATGEGEGAVSWLNYAFRLMYLPIGLFGVSVATATLPEVARRAAAGDLAGMRRTVSSGLRLMLMLNVPATVGLVVLAAPIVGLIFERGQFTPFDTDATARALMFYAPGLLGYSAVKICAPSFYALRDARTPVAVSIGAVLLNLVLNLTLVRIMGYTGLALGTALAAVANALVLAGLLARRLGGLDGRTLGMALLKILVASALMGGVAVGAEAWLAAPIPGSAFAPRLVRVCGAIGAALAALALSAKLLRIDEFEEAVRRVLTRLRG